MERRSHIRYELRRDIKYVLNLATSEEVFKGITVNISDVGLGMYTFDFLRVGQEITITSGLDDTCREGTIKWCEELGENVYRVGLLFNTGERFTSSSRRS